ncbi:MAG: hypothetical protein QOJ69_1579 [Actinomycetota bacterium]|nr:hypothetical protein [Actinomycetota bacterium]
MLTLLLVVFLWTPLSTGGAYSTADLLQGSPLFGTVGPGYEFGNPLLTDPVIQMQPWLEWNWDQLSRGDLPVWNPYNGAGAPHLATFVSAVLSPFSLPRYLLPVVPGLLLAAGLKLFVLGLFTYLFLRRVSVSHLGALVGAAAFTFVAYNVVWLSWPHSGAAVCLPAGLYFAEAALQARTRLRARLAWGGYAAAVVVSFLAGHPETLFFSWGVVLAYVPLRLAFSPSLRGRRLRQLGAFALAGVLAVGLSAVQLVPFLEYLTHSTSYEEGSDRAQAHFDVGYSALHAFPQLFGAPNQHFHEPLRFVGSLKLPDGTPVQSNFNESVGFYVGLLAVLLAGVGAVWAVRRRSFVGIFLAVLAVGWFVYVHDLGGIGHTVGTLPVVELSAINRSHPVWAFAVCCLAALGFDALAGVRRDSLPSLGRRGRRTAAAGVATAGTLLLALAVVLARETIERTDGREGVVTSALGRAAIDDHVRYIAITFLVGVAVLAVLAAFGDRRLVRVGAAGAVIAVVFAQSGWLLRDYNPTIDEKYFFGSSPGLEALTAAAGPGEETVSLGPLLSADANLWYRLRSSDNYDGMGVYRYDLLQRHLKALPEPTRSVQMFDLLGIRYAASDEQAWPTAAVAGPLLSVGPGPDAEATFTAIVPGLNGMGAYTEGVADGAGDCQVTLDLVDTASSEVVGRSTAECKLPFTALTFPTQADSAGRTYTARFGGTGNTVAMLSWAAAVPGLEQVEVNESLAAFRAPATPPRYVSPPTAVPVTSDEQALGLLSTPGFSMGDVALVHGDVDPAHAGGPAGTVEVVSQRATEVRLKVDRATPGWLVARQTWFPGWTASVNGKPVELVRADVAFTAVPVGAGTSEVVLRYRPESVRYGLLASAVSLVVLIAWVAAAGRVNGSARRRARRERRDRLRQAPEPTS